METLQLLKQSLETRRERWGHFRKKIVARARCTFLHVLSERSFNGKLKVDHKARKLEIEVTAACNPNRRNSILMQYRSNRTRLKGLDRVAKQPRFLAERSHILLFAYFSPCGMLSARQSDVWMNCMCKALLAMCTKDDANSAQ